MRYLDLEMLESARDALAVLQKWHFDALIAARDLPGGGASFLRTAKDQFPFLRTLLLVEATPPAAELEQVDGLLFWPASLTDVALSLGRWASA